MVSKTRSIDQVINSTSERINLHVNKRADNNQGD